MTAFVTKTIFLVGRHAWPTTMTQTDRLTGVDLGCSLQNVLGNPELYAMLKAKMDSKFTGEGLAFLEACTVNGDTIDKPEATGLMEQFILDNAPFQINVAGDLRGKLVDAYHADQLDLVCKLLKSISREVFDDVKRSETFNAFLRAQHSRGAIVLKHRHTVLSEDMYCILGVANNLSRSKKLLKILAREGDYYWSNRLRFLSSMALDFDACDSKVTRANMGRKIINLYLIKGGKFEISIAAFLYENIVVHEKFNDLDVLRTEVAEELSLSSFVKDCINEMDATGKTSGRMSMSSPLNHMLKQSEKSSSPTRTSPSGQLFSRTLSELS